MRLTIFSYGRRTHLHRPLDLLRRWRTGGLEVDAGLQEVRRGKEVEALVTITRPGELGTIEVGLCCTEYYDKEVIDTDQTATTSRETSTATAYEAWVPVESGAGVQSVRLAVPREAPFSYKGDCLSFKWEIVARGRRPHRLDAQARREISVLP
jgi:hypothetical protein